MNTNAEITISISLWYFHGHVWVSDSVYSAVCSEECDCGKGNGLFALFKNRTRQFIIFKVLYFLFPINTGQIDFKQGLSKSGPSLSTPLSFPNISPTSGQSGQNTQLSSHSVGSYKHLPYSFIIYNQILPKPNSAQSLIRCSYLKVRKWPESTRWGDCGPRTYRWEGRGKKRLRIRSASTASYLCIDDGQNHQITGGKKKMHF